MEENYSFVDTSKILFSLMRFSDITNFRQDLSKENEFLQVNARKFEKGTFIKPHKHLKRDSKITLTQECWIIFKGIVCADIYDIDDNFYKKVTLKAGDCIVFFNGGHSLKVEEDNSIMYEIKNGPYLGIEKDKTSI